MVFCLWAPGVGFIVLAPSQNKRSSRAQTGRRLFESPPLPRRITKKKE